MQALTLRSPSPASSDLWSGLATEDGRFTVGGRVCRDSDWAYLHLGAGFHYPSVKEEFGAFHLVVDLQAWGLLGLAVGEDHKLGASRISERMGENQINIERDFEYLNRAAASKVSATLLAGGSPPVTLRALAYARKDPSDQSLLESNESLICVRLWRQEFGAMQIVISDLGRLLAVATGRRDRDAYQRVRHELARRGIELDGVNQGSQASEGAA